MKKKPITAEEREKYWTTVIEAARAYPQGVKQYCEDRGISQANYYLWFAKLRRLHPEWTDLPKPTKRRAAAAKSKNSNEPATQVVPSAGRRRFSAEYKTKILKETDNAADGEVAAILRREGLYSSHLQSWRTERAQKGLAPKQRGPKKNPLTAENRTLRAENARLQKKIRQQELLLELQKKVSEILNVNLDQSADND